MSDAPLLRIAGLSVAYDGMTALRDASLEVRAGEVVGLFGANGAGKSTLLRAVIGLVPAAGGEITLEGMRIERAAPERRARLGIGYAPEGRRVFPGMSVQENLEVACRGGAAERGRRVAEIVDLFPAVGEFAGAAAWQLSGGQQQMLAIGRALMAGRKLLLLDEPSLGVAPRLTATLLERIRAIAARGTAILLAEQNALHAATACDRAYVLALGRVVREGKADEIAADPALREAFLGRATR